MYVKDFNLVPKNILVAGSRGVIDKDVSCLNTSTNAKKMKDKSQTLKVLLNKGWKIDNFIIEFHKH